MRINYYKTLRLLPLLIMGCVLSLPSFAGPQLDHARNLLSEKNYSQALHIFDELASKHPKDFHLIVETAIAYSHADKHREAIIFYNKALALNPKAANLYLPLAWQLLWNDQHGQAREYFQRYLKIYPNNKEARNGLVEARNPGLTQALVHERKGELHKAIPIYKEVVRKNPHNATFYKRLARLYAHDDQHGKAITVYKKALSISGDKSLYLPLAQQYLWSYQPVPALKYFKLAKRYDKKHIRTIEKGILAAIKIQRVGMLFKLQQMISDNHMPKAYQYAQQLESLDPNNDVWVSEIADVFSAQGYHEYSSHLYHKAIAIAPEAKIVYATPLAWDYVDLGKMSTACKMFHSLYDNNYRPEPVINGIGYCVQYYGSTTKALRYYQNLIDNDSGGIEWYLRLAQIYLDRNEYGKAEAVLDKLLGVLPYNVDALELRGSVYNYADENFRAIHFFRNYVQKIPSSNKLKIELARSYYWLGLYDEAYNVLNNGHPVKTRNEHEMFDLIKRSSRNQLYIYTGHTNDTNNLNHSTLSFELQHYITRRTSLAAYVGLGRTNEEINQSWQHGALELQTRFGGADSKYGILWPSLSVGSGQFGNWHPFLWKTKFNWLLNDHVNNIATAGSEVVYGALGEDKRVLFTRFDDELILSSRNWQSHLTFLAGRFNDNNKRYLGSADLLYRIYPRFNVFIGPAVKYFDNTSDITNNGYYNPRQYGELALLTKAVINIYQIYFDPYVKLGYYRAKDPETNTQPLFNLGLLVTKDFTPFQEVSLELAYFNSGGSASGGGDAFQGGENYQQFTAVLGYQYDF